ncbi:MAG: MBL fold metallo-hydrolase [Sphingomonadaceae bacterium]|nr:MBL fold metallo-hydrolase [Sphingomonadaceae bacterium]
MKRTARWIGTTALFAIVALCLAIVVVPHFLDRVYYRGSVSAHFDGTRFFNPDGEDTFAPAPGGSRGSFIVRYLLGTDDRPPWPKHVAVTPTKPAARIEGERMVATWIGHATVLVQTNGLNILTDPIYADSAGPFGFGPKRVAAPGVAFNDLPKIDLILISHDHYDHMDLTTLRRLWKRDRPLIVTSLGNDAVMKDIPSVARDWGGRVTLRPGIDVIVTRNHHWGSRWFADRDRALWSSFVVTLPGGNLFFAGDTGFGDGKWPGEARAYGPIRLALLPIGAFRFAPGQMQAGSHVGPVQSAEISARLGAARAIPIHWGTFRLSYEAYDTPPRLLRAVTACRAITGFAPVAIGRPVEIPAYAPPAPARPLDPRCIEPAVGTLR